VWRYVNAELSESAEVCPGVVYESTPSDHAVRSLVEETLNERMIQVVWRGDHDES